MRFSSLHLWDFLFEFMFPAQKCWRSICFPCPSWRVSGWRLAGRNTYQIWKIALDSNAWDVLFLSDIVLKLGRHASKKWRNGGPRAHPKSKRHSVYTNFLEKFAQTFAFVLWHESEPNRDCSEELFCFGCIFLLWWREETSGTILTEPHSRLLPKQVFHHTRSKCAKTNPAKSICCCWFFSLSLKHSAQRKQILQEKSWKSLRASEKRYLLGILENSQDISKGPCKSLQISQHLYKLMSPSTKKTLHQTALFASPRGGDLKGGHLKMGFRCEFQRVPRTHPIRTHPSAVPAVILNAVGRK